MLPESQYNRKSDSILARWREHLYLRERWHFKTQFVRHQIAWAKTIIENLLHLELNYTLEELEHIQRQNGWKQTITVKNGQKQLKVLKTDENGWKMMKFFLTGCKWLETLEFAWIQLKMVWNNWRLKTDENWLKWLKTFESGYNDLIWLKLVKTVDNCWNGLKWIETE